MTTIATATRRQRQRAETESEIKARAWSLMTAENPAALSLREVARQMGMAPSALYRYFASRDDLLTALIVDAFDSLADVAAAEYDRATRAGEDPFEVFLSVARAYRSWAMGHRTEWALVFSTSIPDYNGTQETIAAARRSTAVLLQIMADCVEHGMIDLARLEHFVDDDTMRPALQTWSDNGGHGLPPAALAACLWSYSLLHGAIALDLNHHFPPPLHDNAALFESALRGMLVHISGDPAAEA